MNKYSLALIIGFIFLLSTEADAQSKKYKVGKHKCERVTITDPGELYSSYEFTSTDRDELRNENFSEAEIAKIDTMGGEDHWPASLGNFDIRVDNGDITKQYVVYLVASVGDKYILVIPAKYNQKMAEGWVPVEDIYFIIGKAGVQLSS